MRGFGRIGCSLLGTVLAAAVATPAHLQPGSLSSPAAGQICEAGSRVRITWIQAEYHAGKYALAYSRDGGAAWTSIADWTGPSGDDIAVHYDWLVPDAPGDAVRVRVCQIRNCAESEYVVVSAPFAIVPPAPVRPAPGPDVPTATLRLSVAEGRIRLAFDMERAGDVRLEARDARGSLRATLVAGPHAAGRHDYALAPEGLRGIAAPMFRLRLGGREASLTVLESR